jgi:hypothetical protein
VSNLLPASETPTSDATVTRTPSPTGTRSGSRLNAFQRGSLLVLRAGTSGATVPVTGIAMPLFLDEFSSTASNQSGPLSTLAFPTDLVSGQQAGCTLALGASRKWLYEQEGLPSLSMDGRSVVLPCYSTAVGNALALSDYKTVAIVWADGQVDTSTFTPSVFYGPTVSIASPQAMRCAI